MPTTRPSLWPPLLLFATGTTLFLITDPFGNATCQPGMICALPLWGLLQVIALLCADIGLFSLILRLHPRLLAHLSGEQAVFGQLPALKQKPPLTPPFLLLAFSVILSALSHLPVTAPPACASAPLRGACQKAELLKATFGLTQLFGVVLFLGAFAWLLTRVWTHVRVMEAHPEP